MKPTITLAETTAPDGAVFKLLSHDGQFYLYMNERQVMSTAMTHSEVLLAELGCQFGDGRVGAPRLLVGGLGLGFTLRRALELGGPSASVVTVELLPEIIRWNRELLDGLNDDILQDSRSELVAGDVYDVLRQAAEGNAKFHAILLDVDDGPSSRLQPQNARIYNRRGLRELKSALHPGGKVAFWAAAAEPRLFQGLKEAGFRVEEIPCAKHARAKSRRHRIYVGQCR